MTNFFGNKFQDVKNTNFILFFFVFSLVLLLISIHHPIGDFGNYYYGSKFFRDGIEPIKFYQDIHFFNEQIKGYEMASFFENYTPVPPFSLIFYYPFTFLEIHTAKFIFNLIGLIILCLSLFRVLNSGIDLKYYHWLIIPVMFFPLYSNFAQGQTYLLVLAVMLEVYNAYLQKKSVRAAILIALLFLLKVFPVFVLLFFIFKKDYRIIFLSLLAILILLGFTCLCIGKETVLNYYTSILPRLFRNEIIDPFYYGHQSLNILLKNLFVHDSLSNPSPIINLPPLVVIIESCCIAFIIGFASAVAKTKDSFFAFSMVILFGLISGKYITSYSLLFLLPFLFNLGYFKNKIVMFLMIFLMCNVPLAYITSDFLLLKFFRIFLMLLLAILLFIELKPKLNLKLIAATLVGLVGMSLLFSKTYADNYFQIQNKAGIYFDLSRLNDNYFVVERCMGSRHYFDTIISPIKAHTLTLLNCDNNKIITPSKIINIAGVQNLKKAWLVNDTSLIYLSDLKQGVGFYKFRFLYNIK